LWICVGNALSKRATTKALLLINQKLFIIVLLFTTSLLAMLVIPNTYYILYFASYAKSVVEYIEEIEKFIVHSYR